MQTRKCKRKKDLQLFTFLEARSDLLADATKDPLETSTIDNIIDDRDEGEEYQHEESVAHALINENGNDGRTSEQRACKVRMEGQQCNSQGEAEDGKGHARGLAKGRGMKAHCCGVCGKAFHFRSLLLDHENLHTGSRPYLCQVCGKGFALKDTLRQHSRGHGPAHQCDKCGLRVAARADLAKHARTHTRERPFMCERCGQGFAQSSHLAAHARTHAGLRPHTCGACGRGFGKRSDLTRHGLTHSGHLPFECPVCGRTFRQSGQRANHVKKHHPGAQ